MPASLKSFISLKTFIFLLGVGLQPVVTTLAGEIVVSVPTASNDPVLGIDVGCAVCSSTQELSFTAITPAKQSLGLQVGVISKAPMPYRREILLFRLSAFPKVALNVKAIKKAELRLVSNSVVDPNNQIGTLALQVYHQSLKDSVLTHISMGSRLLSAFDGELVASQATNTMPKMGKELRLDVTQAIRAQLAAGKGGVAYFRLQVENESKLDSSSDAFIQFRGFNSKEASDRPHLEITYGE